MKDVEIQLHTSLDPLEQIDIDQKIPLSDELITILRYEVTNLVRYSYLFPVERMNIGTDKTPITKVPAQDIVKKQPQQQEEQ